MSTGKPTSSNKPAAKDLDATLVGNQAVDLGSTVVRDDELAATVDKDDLAQTGKMHDTRAM